MATGSVSVRGSIDVNNQGCGTVSACGSSASGRSSVALALGGSGCGCAGAGAGKIYEQVIPPTSLSIATTGLPGTSFETLDEISAISAIELFYLESTAPVVVRIGAAPASLTGVGGTFPTTFAGGETLTVEIDGTPLTVTFDVADQSAAQVVGRINAEAALVGLATPRALVDASGQITLQGVLTGAQGSVVVSGGTGAATLGFPGAPSAVGLGEDVRVSGIFLLEPDRNAAPSSVALSGQAQITVVAAGRAAS